MITINLLPQDRRKSTRKSIQVSQDAVVTGAQVIAVALVVLVLGANLFLMRKISATTVQLRQVQVQNDKLQSDLEKLNRLKTELALFADMKGARDHLLKHRINWAKKLEDLSRHLDRDVWLELIEIAKGSSKDAQEHLVLKCVTHNVLQPSLITGRMIQALMDSEFSERLSEPQFTHGFRRRWLSGGGEKDKGVFNPFVWEFEVRCQIELPEGVAPPAAPARGRRR